MNIVLAKRIELNDGVRVREVVGDPYIFLNLQTYKLVTIPVKEGTKERKILGFVVERLKKGTTFKELTDSASKKFIISKNEVEEGLRELLDELAANDMLRVESH